MSRRDSLKNIKNLTDHKLLSGSVYISTYIYIYIHVYEPTPQLRREREKKKCTSHNWSFSIKQFIIFYKTFLKQQ